LKLCEISGINLPRGKGGVSISWPCDITHIVKQIDEGNERIVAIEINADYNLYHLCIHANTQYMGVVLNLFWQGLKKAFVVLVHFGSLNASSHPSLLYQSVFL
jgi:hypothetical protein